MPQTGNVFSVIIDVRVESTGLHRPRIQQGFIEHLLCTKALRISARLWRVLEGNLPNLTQSGVHNGLCMCVHVCVTNVMYDACGVEGVYRGYLGMCQVGFGVIVFPSVQSFLTAVTLLLKYNFKLSK